MTSEVCGYSTLTEPDLIFAGSQTGKHPLLGLINHGPYGLKFGAPRELRFAILAPAKHMQKLKALVEELKKSARPREATNYYPEYLGFQKIFRIPIAVQDERLAINFPDHLERHANANEKVELASGLFQCISKLRSLRSNFDVALIYTTCCSQVFDPDGTGFRFVAYDAREYTQDGKNPFLSYYEMQSVLSRSLEIYQSGHFGRLPTKVTIHKNTEFKEDEILGALDSFREGTEVELVQIVKGANWKGIRFDTKKPPGPFNYPVERGTYLPVDKNEALLWTQGSVVGVHTENPRWNVYKEGPLKPTPSPVLLRRFSGQGGWHETCSGVLGLTKMDWNNNTLYKKLPVTLVYSKAFSKIIQQNPNMVNSVYDFRSFM